MRLEETGVPASARFLASQKVVQEEMLLQFPAKVGIAGGIQIRYAIKPSTTRSMAGESGIHNGIMATVSVGIGEIAAVGDGIIAASAPYRRKVTIVIDGITTAVATDVGIITIVGDEVIAFSATDGGFIATVDDEVIAFSATDVCPNATVGNEIISASAIDGRDGTAVGDGIVSTATIDFRAHAAVLNHVISTSAGDGGIVTGVVDPVAATSALDEGIVCTVSDCIVAVSAIDGGGNLDALSDANGIVATLATHINGFHVAAIDLLVFAIDVDAVVSVLQLIHFNGIIGVPTLDIEVAAFIHLGGSSPRKFCRRRCGIAGLLAWNCGFGTVCGCAFCIAHDGTPG
jgi:hypothetical protein